MTRANRQTEFRVSCSVLGGEHETETTPAPTAAQLVLMALAEGASLRLAQGRLEARGLSAGLRAAIVAQRGSVGALVGLLGPGAAHLDTRNLPAPPWLPIAAGIITRHAAAYCPRCQLWAMHPSASRRDGSYASARCPQCHCWVDVPPIEQRPRPTRVKVEPTSKPAEVAATLTPARGLTCSHAHSYNHPTMGRVCSWCLIQLGEGG